MKNKTISIFWAIWCQNLWDELILKNEIKILKEEFWENTKFFVFTYDKKDIFFDDKNIVYKEYFPIGLKKIRSLILLLFDDEELFLTKKIKAQNLPLIYGFLEQKYLENTKKRFIFLEFELM